MIYTIYTKEEKCISLILFYSCGVVGDIGKSLERQRNCAVVLWHQGLLFKTKQMLSQSLKDVEAELTILEEQNQILGEQKAKLEDPEYVKSYARSTYMLTKDGEQIYYLPEEGE